MFIGKKAVSMIVLSAVFGSPSVALMHSDPTTTNPAEVINEKVEEIRQSEAPEYTYSDNKKDKDVKEENKKEDGKKTDGKDSGKEEESKGDLGVDHKADLKKSHENVGKEEKKATFFLKGINYQSDIPQMDLTLLSEIEKKYIDRNVSIDDLKELATAITVKCRKEGFLGAIAYLPPQNAKDKTITIGIATSTFGKANITNESDLDTKVIERIALKRIKNGNVVNGATVEDVLYHINDLGGVRATGNLVPSKEINGAVDLDIKVVTQQPQRTILYAENYGQKSTGRYRFGAIHNRYNIDGKGSNLQLSGVLSNELQKSLSVDYSILADAPTGTRVGINFGVTDYDLAGDFKDLDGSGKSYNATLYGKTSFYKTVDNGISWEYGLKFRDITSDYDAFNISNKRRSFAVYNKVAGYQRFPNGVFNWSLKMTNGSVKARSDYAKLISDYYHTDGFFTKVEATAGVKHMWTKQLEFSSDITVQGASKRLDSSEQIFLGGANGIRAYGDGDGSGDTGFISRTDIIYNTKAPGLAFNVFYDLGKVKNKIGNGRIESISGWGVGVSYTKPNDYFVKLEWGRKIGFNHNVSSDRSKNRVWLMVGKVF